MPLPVPRGLVIIFTEYQQKCALSISAEDDKVAILSLFLNKSSSSKLLMLFVTLEFFTLILGVFFRRIEHALPCISTLNHASAFTVEGFYGRQK